MPPCAIVEQPRPGTSGRGRIRSLLRLGSLALFLLACSEEAGQRAPAAPQGPPNLRFDAIRAPGRATWRPGEAPCLAPGLDPDGTLVVDMGERVPGTPALRNWTFRGYGGCGALPQCGPLILGLRDAETGEVVHSVNALQVSVPIAFGRLGFPPGRYDLTATLVDDQGRPPVIDGGVVMVELDDLRIDPLCAPSLPEAGVETGPIGETGGDARATVRDAGPDADGLDASLDGPTDDASIEAGPDAASTDASPSPDASLPIDASPPTDASFDTMNE
jgi:hypothetical protein